MFCTPSDFDLLPYAIPNLTLVANTFPLYIEEKEREALTKLLGSQFYNEFIAGLEALPPDWEPAPVAYTIGQQVVNGVSIWQALADNSGVEPVEGADWTKVEDNKWLQLEKGFGFSYYGVYYEWLGMVDMLKPYIFSYWLRDTFDNASGIGVVQGKAENAEVIAPATRIARAYNQYAHRAYVMYYYMEVVNSTTDPPPLYPSWNLQNVCEPGTMNTFGI